MSFNMLGIVLHGVSHDCALESCSGREGFPDNALRKSFWRHPCAFCRQKACMQLVF